MKTKLDDLTRRDSGALPEGQPAAATVREGCQHCAELLTILEAARGYMTNAAIDLETGAPKRTALDTINGGLAMVRKAIARAGGRP